MSRATIDVRNRAGVKQGDGPLYTATDFQYTRRLNRAGSFRFRLPKRDARSNLVYSTLGAKASIVELYWDGVLEFRGIVENLRVNIDNTGNIFLQVEGRDMLAELSEVPVAYLELAAYRITHGAVSGGPYTIPETVGGGTSGATGQIIYDQNSSSPFYLLLNPIYTPGVEFQASEVLTGVTSGATSTSVTVVGRAGVPDGPQRILTQANLLTPATWTLDTTDGYALTATDAYAKFAGESALQALIKVAEHTGERFRMGSGMREIVWLQDETPTATVRAIQTAGDPVAAESNDNICFILRLEEIQDAYEVVNRVYPYGSGVGDTRLSLSATSRTASGDYTLSKPNNYIENSASITALGATIARYVEFKDLRPIANTDQDVESAANALYDAALAWLQRRDEVSDNKAYSLEVMKFPATVQPGDRIRVVYEDDAYSINEEFFILEITTRTGQDGTRTTGLTISTTDGYPASDSDIQAEQIERGVVFSSHPQMNANSYRENFRVFVGEDQADEKAEVRWWFGPEVVQIQQVLWRFNLTEITSPSSTIGGTVASTTSGGGATVASAGGSSHTHSVPAHKHDVFTSGSLGAAATIGISGGGGVFTNSSGGDLTADTSLVSGGTTSASESTHTHSVTISAHSHDIDVGSALSTSFGIFRESAANTFSVSDLEYQVNGGGWADLTGATSHGGDWYSVDVTDDVQQANSFRPVQEGNLLEVRRKSAGATSKTAMLDGALEIRNIIQAIAYT